MMTLNMGKNASRFLALATVLFSLAFAPSCGTNSGNNIKIPGVTGPILTIVEDSLLISMSFDQLNLNAGLRFAIPHYDHSYIELTPNQTGVGLLMGVSISVQDVLNNANLQRMNPQTLPGGRALPGVLGGTLPAVAFSIEKFNNMAVYLGPSVFGIFVPMNLNIQGSIATFRYYVSNKVVGNISLVGTDTEGKNSGFLLLLNIDAATKRMMQQLAAQYGH